MVPAIHLDERIRVAEGVSVTGHQMRDSFPPRKDLPHLAQLVVGFSRCNTMSSKATFGVIDHIEIPSSLVKADDILKTSR